MEIFIERTGKIIIKKIRHSTKHTADAKKNLTVASLLKELKINPEAVLVTKNNVLVTPDARLDDTDKVKILSVISGG